MAPRGLLIDWESLQDQILGVILTELTGDIMSPEQLNAKDLSMLYNQRLITVLISGFMSL